MYSHMMVGANDMGKAKAFYDATFKAMGGREGRMDEKGRLIYMHNGGLFIVTKPNDGQPATHGNGCTIGLAMTPEQADAWHQAGIENGGTAIEDPPGVRGAAGRCLCTSLICAIPTATSCARCIGWNHKYADAR